VPTVYRIGTAGPSWDEADLEGNGSKATGGRWNNTGTPMVYGSSSIALAVLETIVHLGAGLFPMNRYIIAVHVPDDEFEKRKVVGGADLPDAWDSHPASFKSMEFGTKWINLNRELVMQVPSAIVPLESNFLLNPRNSVMTKVRAKNLGKYVYDPRSVPRFATS